MENNIPKKIYYCWFGGGELGELERKCINSWKKYLPEYEIIECNESNFDININKYVKEAYLEKKYAFVSDYARFYILYKNGGVYFDTDVELIAEIDDILEKGPFMAREAGNFKVNSGLGMAANANMEMYKRILKVYDSKKTFTEDKENVVDLVTRILEEQGYSDIESENIQKVENISIYPPEYFCPKNYYSKRDKFTSRTRSIHHYSDSWHTGTQKKIYEVKARYKNSILKKIILIPLVFRNQIELSGIKGTVVYFSKKIVNRFSK